MEKNSKHIIGNGLYGTCYLQGNEVIKVYFNAKEFPCEQYGTKGIENGTYVFAKDILLTKEKGETVYMITMSPVFSLSTGKIAKPLYKQDASMDKLIDSVSKAYSDTDKLSTETKIITTDVAPRNILFDDRNIKVVDTDLYSFSVKSEHEVINENIANLNRGICQSLFGKYDKNGIFETDILIKRYIYSDERLRTLYCQIKNSNTNDNRMLPAFLIELRKKIEEDYDKPITTTQDIKKTISR